MAVTDEMVERAAIAIANCERKHISLKPITSLEHVLPMDKPFVLEEARAALEAALSLPVSNTGENAGLVLCERDDVEGGYFPVDNHERHVPLSALAAADARIAELEVRIVLKDDEIADLKEFDRLGTIRYQTAETLLEEARRALEPFIRLADNVFRDGKNATVADEVTLWCFNDTDITFGDLRRVRATRDRIGKS